MSLNPDTIILAGEGLAHLDGAPRPCTGRCMLSASTLFLPSPPVLTPAAPHPEPEPGSPAHGNKSKTERHKTGGTESSDSSATPVSTPTRWCLFPCLLPLCGGTELLPGPRSCTRQQAELGRVLDSDGPGFSGLNTATELCGFGMLLSPSGHQCPPP